MKRHTPPKGAGEGLIFWEMLGGAQVVGRQRREGSGLPSSSVPSHGVDEGHSEGGRGSSRGQRREASKQGV